MPELDIGAFNSLPGDRSQNFEDLCRGLMRLHYGRAGTFKALVNQPGVEFHLQLINECNLGSPPRWFGWQCKYHQLTQSGNLKSSSKTNIKSSLRKTEHHLPGISDWILWTPYTLSKKDQEWYYGLSESTDMSLDLWNKKDLELYLSGEGLMLRRTYFGELVMTPKSLERQHEVSTQSIIDRWMEPVHQIVDAERIVRRMLEEPGSWNHLHSLGERLKGAAAAISAVQISEIKSITEPFISRCEEFAEIFLNFHNILAKGDLEIIYQKLNKQKTLINSPVHAVPRHLRSRNLSIAIDATNALDDMRIAQESLDEAEEYLGVGVVAVMADAGGGKTQMAAQLTAPQKSRPAGILLHGRNLQKGQDLNSLASRITIDGNPVPGIESLIGALDAAAKRSRCRLPIVIDGLNEAEDPKDWKPLLAELREIVRRYPNVLVVCSVRTGERPRNGRYEETANQSDTREMFAKWALPDDIMIIESEGFGSNVDDAIEEYFSYYKINPGEAEIPRGLFRNPLTLRIFCEVTNPNRDEKVEVGYFPASLSPLLGEYITNACERIPEYPNLSYQYSADMIRTAIYQLGLEIWKSKKREIYECAYRDSLSYTGFQWDQWDSNIINLLSQEGIIFRDPGSESDQYSITPVFDTLGGYVVADSLLTKHQDEKDFKWLQEQEVADSFGGQDSHELASDIYRSLVTLTPHFHETQLWKEIAEPFQRSALGLTVELEPQYLDNDTIEALKVLLKKNEDYGSSLYSRLSQIRGSVEHPLNSQFIDSALREMPMAERDLNWSEWIRRNSAEIFNDLHTLEARWKDNMRGRTNSDQLNARWVMWLFTSTDRGLRDVATRTIYWFGRGDPTTLFGMTINSLGINDPYVPERMLAASYGVAMAYYSSLDKTSFINTTLADYVKQLYKSIFAKDADYSTTHMLMREYAAHTIELAILNNPDLFDTNELEHCRSPYTEGKLDDWGESHHQKDRHYGRSSPFRMDFENYTIGRLVPDRGNYDYEHEEYQTVRSQILWRIEQLGWSKEKFGTIDREIEDFRHRPWEDKPASKIDRYGKKYSWIAYFELSGALHDKGVIENWRERTSSVDIDPSFPDTITKGEVIKLNLLGKPDTETSAWISQGAVPNFNPYLKMDTVRQEAGPWILLDGFITQEDKNLQRNSFCFIRSFLVDRQLSELFTKHLSKENFGGSRLPETPSVIYTFAGEIPWCEVFPKNGMYEFPFVVGKEKKKVIKTQKGLYLNGEKSESVPPDLVRKFIYDHNRKDSSDQHEKPEGHEIDDIEIREVAVETEEIIEEYEKIEALVPVCDFGWEGYQSITSDTGYGTTLAKEISLYLDLVGYPQTFDLYTKNGKKATLNISNKNGVHNNYQSLLFMRKGLLETYLDSHDLELIWVVWGERKYLSNRYFNQTRDSCQPDPPYKKYHFVRSYKRLI